MLTLIGGAKPPGWRLSVSGALGAGRNSNCGFSPVTFSHDRQTRACQESCWDGSFRTPPRRRTENEIGFSQKGSRSCASPRRRQVQSRRHAPPPNAAAARRHRIRIGNVCSVIALPPLPIRRGDDSNAPFCRPPLGPTDEAPVAQLDRALPSEGKGHTFESCRARHLVLISERQDGLLPLASTAFSRRSLLPLIRMTWSSTSTTSMRDCK